MGSNSIAGLWFSKLKESRRQPLTKGIDVDSAESISLHKQLIESNAILRSIYRFWYSHFLPSVMATKQLRGPMIEIGCGASHLEKYIPGIVKTDCVAHSNIHQVVDAKALPFCDGSLRGVFVLNAFHHFEDPHAFLSEVQRCLAPGGRLVITEPSNSSLQKFMIKKFHPYEYFDETATEWRNTPQGRLSRVNNAMPWIVFERDRAKMLEAFPRLKLIQKFRHTYFIYFASGGLSYRPFLPTFSLPFLWAIEKIMGWLFPRLGTEMTFVFEKV